MRLSKPSVRKKLKHWIKADVLCALYDQLNEVLLMACFLQSVYINPKLSRCVADVCMFDLALKCALRHRSQPSRI